MANPPFAGDIKESRIIHKYELGYNNKNKPKSKVGRDILFIERNLDLSNPVGVSRLSYLRADSIIPRIKTFGNT